MKYLSILASTLFLGVLPVSSSHVVEDESLFQIRTLNDLVSDLYRVDKKLKLPPGDRLEALQSVIEPFVKESVYTLIVPLFRQSSLKKGRLVGLIYEGYDHSLLFKRRVNKTLIETHRLDETDFVHVEDAETGLSYYRFKMKSEGCSPRDRRKSSTRRDGSS